MRINIELDCNNAAFGDSREDRLFEAGRILREAGRRLFAEGESFNLRDANGNTVGRVAIDEDE